MAGKAAIPQSGHGFQIAQRFLPACRRQWRMYTTRYGKVHVPIIGQAEQCNKLDRYKLTHQVRAH